MSKAIKKSTVVLAGHTGFVGKNLLEKLRINDAFNLVLLSRSDGFDLADASSLKDIHCDTIINLAGNVSIEDGWSDPHSTFKDNYLITLNLLELARVNKANFIHISSYIYGTPEYQPVDENHSISGYNPYASSKLISDILCSDYGKYFNFPVTILRLFNLYGIGQKTSFLIAGLLDTIISNKPLDIKDLHARRDYLWIDDLVLAIEEVLYNQEKGVNVFNIGSGVSSSALEVIETIEKCTNQKVRFSQNNPEKILVQDCRCDNRLFSDKYNWKPRTSLAQGIKNISRYMGI
jgi:nucleoside-diphosphate-sugar epimerase